MTRKSLITIAVLFLAGTLIGERRRGVRPAEPPTFSNEVVRIFQDNCQSCHHEGGIGPFPLMTYDEAAPQAGAIAYMTREHLMPPWRPDDTGHSLKDVRQLSDDDINTLQQWWRTGAREGNREDLPEPLVFENGWQIGAPDFVFFNGESFMPATIEDTYRCFSIPYDVGQDRWLRSVDVRPGDAETVHHVIAFLDRAGTSKQLDENDAGPGYECFGGPGIRTTEVLAGWAPGNPATELPDDVGIALPATGRIVLQVHYSPHFRQPLPDQTEVGFYFTDGAVDSELAYDFAVTEDFRIPAGATAHDVYATERTPTFRDLTLYSVYPHMHLLGKSIEVELIKPGGGTERLINIPAWDFRWQQNYSLVEPVRIPGGSTLRVHCTFDNSTENFDNPNHPPKEVTWGELSTDEMCLAMLGFTQ